MVDEMTMSNFIKRYGVSMSVEYTDSNPNMIDSSGLKWSANHYRVTFKRRENGKRRQMSLYFSQGQGIKHEPRVGDVLDCLSSDSTAIEQSYGDWCSDFGYDTDSISADKTYRICVKQAKRLKAFLGDEGFEQLLYHTERL